MSCTNDIAVTSTRRRRRQAQSCRLARLLRQFGEDEFPATVIIHRQGRALARLVREADFKEMASLMAEHLQHLADEGEKDAIPMDEVFAELDERRAARRRQREER